MTAERPTPAELVESLLDGPLSAAISRGEHLTVRTPGPRPAPPPLYPTIASRRWRMWHKAPELLGVQWYARDVDDVNLALLGLDRIHAGEHGARLVDTDGYATGYTGEVHDPHLNAWIPIRDGDWIIDYTGIGQAVRRVISRTEAENDYYFSPAGTRTR